jgi:hypothetical protein
LAQKLWDWTEAELLKVTSWKALILKVVSRAWSTIPCKLLQKSCIIRVRKIMIQLSIILFTYL